jgi:hypothetical protein
MKKADDEHNQQVICNVPPRRGDGGTRVRGDAQGGRDASTPKF